MIDGFLFSIFFDLLVVVVGGVVERRREGWSSTQLELGEKIRLSSVVCVLEKKTNSLCIVGSLTQRGQGLA